MKRQAIQPLALAIGLAFAGSAAAETKWDFSGSNFYMKFLDGNQRGVAMNSIDTSSGSDQGQFTEFNLVFKATISPQVEAGGRIQSRSSASYWSEYSGFGSETGSVSVGCPAINSVPAAAFGCSGSSDNGINHQKFMKLRGAYIELTPGYGWLSNARIGTSDWNMFDPATVGGIRYIDRDNINGLYFKGPLPGRSTWEFARISNPEYLGVNFGEGTNKKMTATYIAQVKVPVSGVRLTGSYQTLNDETSAGDSTPFNGMDLTSRSKNSVWALKADTSIAGIVDFRGAYYHSSFSVDNARLVADDMAAPRQNCYLDYGGCGVTTNSYLQTGVFGYSMTPGANVDDRFFKINLDWSNTPLPGFSVSYQYFNVGAGYVTFMGARREADVLLTEGSEAAWYGWGNPLWSGGRANDMQQLAVIQVDNGYTDFDEPGAESSIGWKGNTFKFNYEVANTPMSLELTRVGYNTNWQNYGGNPDIYDVGHGQGTYDVYNANQDRSTDIYVLKVDHVFPIAGGLDTKFKWKHVKDTDNRNTSLATDDRETKDNGYSITVGNQLFNDLYGSLGWGHYTRDVTDSGLPYNNSKSIYTARVSYNLAGFELGGILQSIKGTGQFTSGVDTDINQYRMKVYAQVNF